MRLIQINLLLIVAFLKHQTSRIHSSLGIGEIPGSGFFGEVSVPGVA
jgi:hypothetical protein